jgi:hypothetical protein
MAARNETTKLTEVGLQCLKIDCCPCANRCERYVKIWQMASDSAAEAKRVLVQLEIVQA